MLHEHRDFWQADQVGRQCARPCVQGPESQSGNSKYFPVVGEAFPQPLLHYPGLGVRVRLCKILYDRLGLVLSPREDVGWF